MPLSSLLSGRCGGGEERCGRALRVFIFRRRGFKRGGVCSPSWPIQIIRDKFCAYNFLGGNFCLHDFSDTTFLKKETGKHIFFLLESVIFHPGIQVAFSPVLAIWRAPQVCGVVATASLPGRGPLQWRACEPVEELQLEPATV